MVQELASIIPPAEVLCLKVGKENENQYTMNQTLADGSMEKIILNTTEKEKDLGIVVNNKLSFKDHVALGFIFSPFKKIFSKKRKQSKTIL